MYKDHMSRKQEIAHPPPQPQNSRIEPGFGSSTAAPALHRASFDPPQDQLVHAPSSTRSASGKAQETDDKQSGNLLFLNYSNPSEFKSRSNKRIVKRWASINTNKAGHAHDYYGLGDSTASQASNHHVIETITQETPLHASRSRTIANGSVSDLANAQRDDAGREGGPHVFHTHPDLAPKRSSSASRSSSERNALAHRSRRRRMRRSSKKPSTRSSEETRPFRRLLPASWNEPSASPSPIIEKVFRDPFDVLPFKADPHVQELLSLYLNAQLLSPTWTQTEDNKGQFQSSLSEYRKSFWFPLMRDSVAAFAALVAFIDCTPGLSVKVRRHGYLEKYQNLALSKANEELADPIRATKDSTLLAVVLLMIAAQRTNDIVTFRVHARGLSLLLKKRRENCQQAGRGLDQFAHCFDSSTAALSTRTESASQRDPYEATDPLAQRRASSNETTNFYDLWRLGLLSAHVCYFHAFNVTLVALGLEAGEDHIAASSTVQHIFLESVQPLPPLNPLENACFLTMRLLLHCLVQPVRSQDDKVTLSCIFGIGYALMDFGIEELLGQVPHAVVWMCLVAASQAGEIADSHIRVNFGAALRQGVEACEFSNFQAAVRYLDEHFLWVPTLHEDALDLWIELGLPRLLTE